jgi:hypothetical protein
MLSGCGGVGEPQQQTDPKGGGAVSGKFEPTVMDFQSKAENCSISVDFSSVGVGIAEASRRQMEDLLEKDPAVIGAQRFVRGREGEVELCVRLRDDRDIGRIFQALQATIPERSNGRGVRIRARNGLEFSN